MKNVQTFANVAQQLAAYNANVLELLSKLNNISASNSTVDVTFVDANGNSSVTKVPSIGFLQSEIQRLNNNINSLYNLDNTGSFIQLADNRFRKVITTSLNLEPATIPSLETVSNFKSKKNFFFDSLLNPQLFVSIDLNNKIDETSKKVIARRYIVRFNTNNDGTLTSSGESARNSFNATFKGKTDITLNDFLTWHGTTVGVVSQLDPLFDEQMYDLEPNEIRYDGVFSVLSVEDDTLNRVQFYNLNTLDYVDRARNTVRQLAVNDELVLNKTNTTTRYRILEINTLGINPKVRLERIEGYEPIPSGVIGALKIYSPVLFTKRVDVSIGYDEYNVLFLKAINTDTNIIAKDWSLGTAYYTNDLRLSSNDGDNGSLMEDYYTNKVFDYGDILEDLVQKKIPQNLGGIPTPPVIIPDNFKVVQINKHLTENKNTIAIKNKFKEQKELNSKLNAINTTIQSQKKLVKANLTTSTAQSNQQKSKMVKLEKQREELTKQFESITNEISNLSNTTSPNAAPKYRLRGFWDIPEDIQINGSRPQSIIQFKIRYRYVSLDGNEAPTENIKFLRRNLNAVQNISTGAVSANIPLDESQSAILPNWEYLLTDKRERVQDPVTGELVWQIQDISNADTPNINQLDIPIQKGERIEFQIKSISEVGWPDSPIESEWSELITKEFPEDLNDVLDSTQFILSKASTEQTIIAFKTDLDSKGLTNHLEDAVEVNGNTYFHGDDTILTSVLDSNGARMPLNMVLNTLINRIASLEEQLNRAKGILDVTVLQNTNEFPVISGSELNFNIECEDYLDVFTGTGAPTGRVYQNNIYVVRDFVVRIRNAASSSPLGLLTNRNYYVNSEFTNTSAPQVFWVNEQDELLFNNATGVSRTQLDNQFLWSANYISVDNINITKLSDNIGNSFTVNNSLTAQLATTTYNIGYDDNSLLAFVNANNSILEPAKWVDNTPTVSSNSKLLTTIHPVVQNLESLVDNNTQKIRTINPGSANDIIIPIKIYFKMNALDPNSGTGVNYQYVNLNGVSQTTKHQKRVKFYLENENDSKPFQFSILFNINRAKIGIQKITPQNKTTIASKTS